MYILWDKLYPTGRSRVFPIMLIEFIDAKSRQLPVSQYQKRFELRNASCMPQIPYIHFTSSYIVSSRLSREVTTTVIC